MNQRTVLQIPMTMELRESAASAAIAEGFSSLQEAVRVILKKLANREMRVAVTSDVRMSKAAEARYIKMDKDFETGENVYTVGVDSFLDDLKNHAKASTVHQDVRKTLYSKSGKK